jgi:hypothetical protein
MDHDTMHGKGLFCCSGGVKTNVDQEEIVQLENALRRSSPKGYRGHGDTARGYRKREAIPLFKLWLHQIVQSDLSIFTKLNASFDMMEISVTFSLVHFVL